MESSFIALLALAFKHLAFSSNPGTIQKKDGIEPSHWTFYLPFPFFVIHFIKKSAYYISGENTSKLFEKIKAIKINLA